MSEQTIKVFVRVRPLQQKQQTKNNSKTILHEQFSKQLTLKHQHNDRKINNMFSFDGVFGLNTPQSDIYLHTSQEMVKEVMLGYNGTILVYGQTGSGKTHTMMGNLSAKHQEGIIPRCFEAILEQAHADKSKDYLVMCSFVELYNEELKDLLKPNKKIQLRQSPEQGVFINHLQKVPVTTSEEALKLLKRGSFYRTTGETAMNAESSRSHAIFTIYVESLEKEAANRLVGSKFNLVDLAGSQRQGKTGTSGDRFVEATKINLSLSALGKVINSLIEGKGGHIPYRDSKLTRLLQDSLGGNAKTAMIATVSPAVCNYEQTLSTLRYASRAKYVTNVPTINLDPKDALLKEYQSEIKRLRGALKQMQNGTVQLPKLDSLMKENRRITEEANRQKQELQSKIQQLEQKFISQPPLPTNYQQERNLRQQQLTFMEQNYNKLESQMQEMKGLLSNLRLKYKEASRELWQREEEHQYEQEVIKQELSQAKRQNLMLKGVLGMLFTEKQLKNVIGLGSWEQGHFKLPLFYFKDRHTLAFPCEHDGNEAHSEPSRPLNNKSVQKYNSTATSFGARIPKRK